MRTRMAAVTNATIMKTSWRLATYDWIDALQPCIAQKLNCVRVNL